MKAAVRSLDDLRVGEEATFTVVVTEDLVDRFADLTGDRNPLHVDAEAAKQSEFRQRIAHGMLLAGHFSTLVGMYLPGERALYLSQSTHFIKPVYLGDTVRVVGKVLAISRATRVVTIATQLFNERGELIVDGEAKVMVREPRNEGLPVAPASLALDGQVALVTGASRGIGAATASLLAYHGARVVVNYRDSRDEAEAVVAAITAAGGRGIAVQADVAREESVQAMVREVSERLGPVRILVNNASPSLDAAPVERTTFAQFERDFAVIVGGAYHCVKAVLPGMQEAKAGAIVNVVSSYVLGAPAGQIAGPSYVTAKHALVGLTRSLAADLGPRGIRVNAVAPGLTDTALVAQLPARFKDLVAHQTPLKRIGVPSDTARAILFLVSDAASFLSGVCLPVNGGLAMA
jgi:3-oxoacyl-[acyl-carrier protein] reductase